MTDQPATAAGRALLEASMGDAPHRSWLHNAILAIEAQARPAVASERTLADDEDAMREWARQQAPAVASEGLRAALGRLLTAIDMFAPEFAADVAVVAARAALASDAGSVGALDVERLARAVAPCCIAAGTIEHALHINAAYAAGRGEGIGPRIGVRLRDAFWRDSGQYDHLHEHGVMVTHRTGEWCRHQLIGQNYPCPPSQDDYGEKTKATYAAAGEGEQ